MALAAGPFALAGSPAVPPASVPLTFLAAAGAWLAAVGVSVVANADQLTTLPTLPGAVSAVHLCMLGFLTMAVLGAMHQFTPVIAQRPLRSVAAARLTALGLAVAALLLPWGFAGGREPLVIAGGLAGAAAVSLAAWNLSRPLASRVGGVPLAGLRCSLVYLCATVAFGVVYAFDRRQGWFDLLPHRVLAHAHLGLLGWLGLSYLAVAEKLWPMFLLSHRPRQRSGAWAVGLVAGGLPLLAGGLLAGWPWLAWPGGAVVVAGLGCHLASLAGVVRHRRRKLELLHGFVVTSAAFLCVAVILAVLAATLDVGWADRARLAAAEVAALAGWLGLAVIGHAHKIVPFIAYTWLRRRGVQTSPSGRQLLFGDLFHRGVARATFAASAAGFGLIVAGLLAGSTTVVTVGAVGLTAAAVAAVGNLVIGPVRTLQAHRERSVP